VKKKLWILFLIILLILQITGYSSNYFSDPKPVNDSRSSDGFDIELLVYLVLISIAGLTFLIGALFYKMDPFNKRSTIIVAVMALNGAVAILFELFGLLIAYPIIIGTCVILLIYSIKVLIDLFSKNTQKASNTEVNE